MRSLIYTFIILLALGANGWAGTIDSVTEQVNSAQEVEILFNGKNLNEKDLKVFQIQDDTNRIVLDIKNGSSSLLEKGVYKQEGLQTVESIRGSNRSKNQIRFVIDLKQDEKLVRTRVSNDKIQVQLRGNFGVSPDNKVLSTSFEGKDIPTPRLKPLPPMLKVIVIDAGHGGRDPGAIGKSGLQEKKVTLAAAKELERQLNRTGRYKVILSRGGDSYIDHDDRLRVAREQGSDLFISIHADATKGSHVRGASVYTLSDRAKNRSKNIVNSQNWILDVDLSEQSDDVGNILVDLAQRDTLSQSTQFANILISELSQTTDLVRNTHRRAGYYVLLAPDVPAVLLEMGFISNQQDEKLLKSEKHRKKIMTSVVTAIDTYFARQNP